MNTHDTLQYILAEGNRYRALGFTAERAALLRSRMRQGKLSTKKMEELLIEAGATVKSQVDWQLPATIEQPTA